MRKIPAMMVAGLLACCAGPWARADAPPANPQGEEFFEKKIRPVLEQSCYECHSDVKKKVKGKLKLDSYEAMLKGGESGKPAVVPGDPAKSLMIFSMEYTDQDTADHDALLMPPPKNGKPKKLPDAVINDFKEWIKMGAPYPKAAKAEAAPADAKRHWAFVPPQEPAVPQVKDAGWVKNALDRFVLAKLEDKNLHPSNPADKRTLIRRATFDLTGLPPTPQEVEAFEKDAAPDAFEKVVDRLLASPRYGERWGRYWLDVARYSDTKGYVFEEERKYPYSYTYRDWVIRALNEDLPYDQFVVQQIAADKLDLGTDKRPLAAEGFLTLGRRFLNNPPDITDDRIDVVCRGTMALTVGCARCHDHKFDPIPTKDYYSLYSIFINSPENPNPPALSSPQHSAAREHFDKELAKRQGDLDAFIAQKREEVVNSFRQPKALAAYLLTAQFDGPPQDGGYPNPQEIYPKIVGRWKNFLTKAAAAHEPVFSAWRAYAAIPKSEFAARTKDVTGQIAKNPAEPVNPFVLQAFAASPPASMNEVADRYAAVLNQYATSDAREYPEEEAVRNVLLADDGPLHVRNEELPHFLKIDAHQQLARLRSAIEQLKATDPGAPPLPMSLADSDSHGEQHVFIRGNPANLGPVVKPHFLTVLSDGEPRPFTDGSGRLELARAIASKDNPLTARVIANRVWLHHFGKALVRTPSDFGVRSDPPTHPELLDYLALRLEENGWSLKKLHKMIMLSATYQQGSAADPAAEKLDPDNTLISHFNRQRLDWEGTRDSMVFVAGKLDESMGGRSVEILESSRRSVYGFIDRQNLPGVFRAFDFASPDTTSPQRFTTTVPQQALFLMNSPFAVTRARQVLERPEIAGEADPAARVARLYQLVYQRGPSADELTMALAFLEGPSGDSRTVAWQYGYGKYDESTHRVAAFTRLPHFVNNAWQGGPTLPDPKLGWVTLNAAGGHPGGDADHAAIRRWIAPADAVVKISGSLAHRQEQGDGVRGRIVSSRSGELASWNVFHLEAATNLDNVEVKKGDTIDFVVDCRDNEQFDSFEWAPVIKLNEPAVAGNDGPTEWSAASNFTGPTPKSVDAWARYVQVLLESNEFVFVD